VFSFTFGQTFAVPLPGIRLPNQSEQLLVQF